MWRGGHTRTVVKQKKNASTVRNTSTTICMVRACTNKSFRRRCGEEYIHKQKWNKRRTPAKHTRQVSRVCMCVHTHMNHVSIDVESSTYTSRCGTREERQQSMDDKISHVCMCVHTHMNHVAGDVERRTYTNSKTRQERRTKPHVYVVCVYEWVMFQVLCMNGSCRRRCGGKYIHEQMCHKRRTQDKTSHICFVCV